MPSAVLCFCHLRWNFVYQRPQHLLSRFGKRRHVHLWEEPVFGSNATAELRVEKVADGVTVLTPTLPEGMDHAAVVVAQRALLDRYIAQHHLDDFIAWYYTPMALEFSGHLAPRVTVYDCMDELSAFQGAPPELLALERKLFSRADVVFSGGASLYEAKRVQHANVHLFPSSIDFAHFSIARQVQPELEDRGSIPHPRIGFYGVLDERLDRDLLGRLAEQNPSWHFVLLGPVVKITQHDLPHAANLHYLGQKPYSALPGYLAGWDVAMLPFALNESTKFISPTKTPEYLAAGKPVVSTPITDVVRPYGERGFVEIAGTAEEFSAAIQKCLNKKDSNWLEKVDRFLSGMSWDKTFEGMWREIERSMNPKHAGPAPLNPAERSAPYV